MIEDQLTKKINFLLGKNGCGKSTLLRDLEKRLSGSTDWFVRYITPERGGSLTYSPGIENNVATNREWFQTSRRAWRAEERLRSSLGRCSQGRFARVHSDG